MFPSMPAPPAARYQEGRVLDSLEAALSAPGIRVKESLHIKTGRRSVADPGAAEFEMGIALADALWIPL